MKRLTMALAAGLVALGAGLALGCSSATDAATPATDGGAGLDAGSEAAAIPCADDSTGKPGEACTLTNANGSCPGVYVCQTGALTCSGQPPTAELCNGVDDDCDGEVDETFKDSAGKLTQPAHCGTCAVDCGKAYGNTAQVDCDATRPTPACIVKSCAAGFVKVSDTLCIAQATVVCEPCSIDADCLASPGARCITLPDADNPGSTVSVCGKDCSAASTTGTSCPTGYACKTDAAGAYTDQCVPNSGSCGCDGAADGKQIFCTAVGQDEITHQAITCNGLKTCTGGVPGACVAPADLCDGVDNDCNGRIDDAYRDATSGRYDRNPHNCGFCGNDCDQQGFLNATGVCLGGTGAPRCGPQCQSGFFDADGNEANGCECQFVASSDVPDESAVDSNCDGIDGELSNSYFVSPNGSDTNPGTRAAPFRTVQRGVDRAKLDGLRDVLVAQGVYAQNVVLVDGVHAYGGYSEDFAQRNRAQFESVIFGQAPSGVQRGAVTIDGVTQGAAFDGFAVFGSNAPGPSASSYAVSIKNSTSALTVSHNRIVGGEGGTGQNGNAGANGSTGAAGGLGTDGIDSGARDCTSTPLAGGAGGQTVCEATGTNGGNGGSAHCPITRTLSGTTPCSGTASSSCRNTWDGTGTAPPTPDPQGAGSTGQNGGAAAGSITYDRWSDSNNCSLCGLQLGWPHIGGNGVNGPQGGDGAGGNGCASAKGTATAAGWVPGNGASGGDGAHGGGAGGGAAGAGFDTVPGAQGTGAACHDRIGGSGGGGGSGGCRGRQGTLGQGGGGSFGIWVGFDQVLASAPVITQNQIQVGVGGRGGAGGNGGAGGLGGVGGNAGKAVSSIVFCAEPGGRGGNGGSGGHGGAGGGGCGGIAYGIVTVVGTNPFNPDYDSPNTFGAGSGGAAGPGGVSLGASGSDGQGGLTGNTLKF